MTCDDEQAKIRASSACPDSGERLMLLPLYVDADLIDCGCRHRPFGKGHTRVCLRERAEWQREKELAQALRPEDIRWLADHGWDGRF